MRSWVRGVGGHYMHYIGPGEALTPEVVTTALLLSVNIHAADGRVSRPLSTPELCSGSTGTQGCFHVRCVCFVVCSTTVLSFHISCIVLCSSMLARSSTGGVHTKKKPLSYICL